MTELIRIEKRNGKDFVSSLKEIYLDVGMDKTHWSRWIKKNIEESKFFSENIDYQTLAIKANGNETKDFVCTIDMAKHLVMQMATDKAFAYRQYLIDFENKNKVKLPATYKEALLALVAAEEEKERLQLEIEHKHNLIDKMTESYDGLVLRATCRDYVNKKSRETGIHQAELYGKIYRLLGNVLKTDISYQYDKFTKEQRKLVEENKRYNMANKLKGLDRKTPFKYADSKMAISQIEYICDMMGHGSKLLEVMSKVFEVEITEIIDKYNFHSEKNQALMVLDNKY